MIFSIVSIIRTRSFLLHSVEVSGQVIRLERSKTRDQYGYTYAPVFSFATAEGKEFTVISDVSSSPPGFVEGEPVRVRYDPAFPQNARIHTIFQTWGAALLSAFAAFLCSIWGCVILGILRMPW
jgi:hypothetical protein